MPLETLSHVQTLPPMLTMRDLQEYLGVSRPTAYGLAHTQGFPTVRLGWAIRIPREAFFRWLEAQYGGEERP
jgi:excisionase family DNA binding protein